MAKITTIKQVEKLLSKTGFKDFLRSNPNAQFKTSNASCCPIARFLKSKKVTNPIVFPDVVKFGKKKGKRDEAEVPYWANIFIDKIDNLKAKRVSARTALPILKQSILESAY